ncbi:hypothetical protein HYPSUDRAFT_882504 [Hypholoma sublateritium FD-334 SS-4]|uniref:Uncharacterized protein n=1 Tax=Hypholoma sublateritium (strain FD-334 SS-4) TaxID=945553 RepID=A0A0D2Q815_HYPSF|nr:hypothetical protein HYPSUDRAFT_882504 [Hypholoma sublateritium FD-334 SS-4]
MTELRDDAIARALTGSGNCRNSQGGAGPGRRQSGSIFVPPKSGVPSSGHDITLGGTGTDISTRHLVCISCVENILGRRCGRRLENYTQHISSAHSQRRIYSYHSKSQRDSCARCATSVGKIWATAPVSRQWAGLDSAEVLRTDAHRSGRWIFSSES